MTINRINFSYIQNGIKSIQQPPSNSYFAFLFRTNPFRTLPSLSEELKNKVAQAVQYAGQTQDQKIKRAVCEELLEINQLLQKESRKGPLKDLIEEFPSIRAQMNKMSVTVNDALVRGDKTQEIWGTRFCPEEALLDSQWEQLMTSSHHLPIEPVSFWKYYILFLASLIWTQLATIFSSRNWWNPISITNTTGKLYLGALPLVTACNNDLNELKKIGINSVLSMVEPFENHLTGFINSAVTPTQWEEAGVKQLQIPMEDWDTGSISDVERGVEFIRWNLMNNRSIYVHCKAGRGRSALVVMAYLIKYENLSATQAFARIRETRPHAGFKESDPKYATLLEYEKRIRKT